MQRDYKIYLNDILIAIEKIENYKKGISDKEFVEEDLVIDAIIRNLEIIGEAAKKIPIDIKRKYPKIEWKKISGLRNILIHEYFGIDLEIVWDIIANKIPELKMSIKDILKNLRKNSDN